MIFFKVLEILEFNEKKVTLAIFWIKKEFFVFREFLKL